MPDHALQHVRRIFPDIRSSWTFGTTADIGTVASALLVDASLAHAFTLPPHNMRVRATQDAEHVHRVRAKVCRALTADAPRLCSMEQVHGCGIASTAEVLTGGCIRGVDGMVVDHSNVVAMALSADCPLIAVFDPRRRVLGVAHAGWRGTVGRIAGKLVEVMVEKHGCNASTMLAAISPSAGPCCYEVGDDVTVAAAALPHCERLIVHKDASVHFDLWSANAAQLIDAGIAANRIDLAGLCTICDRRFFSYRRDGKDTGHAALLATLDSCVGEHPRSSVRAD